jgi:hypothetical protein
MHFGIAITASEVAPVSDRQDADRWNGYMVFLLALNAASFAMGKVVQVLQYLQDVIRPGRLMK